MENRVILESGVNYGVLMFGRVTTIEEIEVFRDFQRQVSAWSKEHKAAIDLVVPIQLEEAEDIHGPSILGAIVAAVCEGFQPIELPSSLIANAPSIPDSVWEIGGDLITFQDEEPKFYLVPSGWCGVDLMIGQLSEEAVEDHQIFGDDDEPTGELDPEEWDEGSVEGEEVAMVSSEDTTSCVEIGTEAIAKMIATDEKVLMSSYYI